MIVLQWNLFRGGQDKAGEKAAVSRKYQNRSSRDDLLLQLRESISAAWTDYLSLQKQKLAYRDAADYSRNTFEAYLNQFSVSKRSLLDVLNAESDYYQSASQLVVVTVNEILEAYRILNLGGELSISRLSQDTGNAEELSQLARPIVFSTAARALGPEPQIQAPESKTKIPAPISSANDTPTPKSTNKSPAEPSILFSMQIGPSLNKRELERADTYLRSQGLDAQQTSGTGMVKFFRLLEGVYPPAEARKRMEALKKAGCSAFVVPEGRHLALYAGSFHQPGSALSAKKSLQRKQIKVTVREHDVEKQGTMLLVHRVEPQLAEKIAKQMLKHRLATNEIRTTPTDSKYLVSKRL
jgi:hypothetical protein